MGRKEGRGRESIIIIIIIIIIISIIIIILLVGSMECGDREGENCFN